MRPRHIPPSIVHEGVKCDGCGSCPLYGVRFKCGHCKDFDLCETCEQTIDHDETHFFLKIKKPIDTLENQPSPLLPPFFNEPMPEIQRSD